jgi:hypothetical protein
MNSRRAVLLAACLFCLAVLSPAAAQWPQQQPAAASPWDQQPQQGLQGLQGIPGAQTAPPADAPPQNCMPEFTKLRETAEKRALLIRSASERKVSAQEACGLFNAFSEAELKMIKYAVDNSKRCGIPPEIVKNLKQGHVKSSEIRTRVCQAAARPAGPPPPSLSDALSAPVPDASNIKTGRGTGTFDTLSGTPLGK